MKILTAFIFLQTLLLITEARSVPPDNSKRVVCYYLALDEYANKTVPLEDLDVSLCSHLVVDRSLINRYANEYSTSNETDIEGRMKFLEDYHKLKEVNPDLKLIAQIGYRHLDDILLSFDWMESKNISHNAVRLVKAIGFDGLDIMFDIKSAELMDKATEVVCDMKTEFEKNDLILTAIIDKNTYFQSDATDGELNYSNISRCYDHLVLVVFNRTNNFTRRYTSLKNTKIVVEKHVQMGIPPKKIVIAIPVTAKLQALADPTDNGLGAKIDPEKKRISSDRKSCDRLIYFKNFMTEIKNSSFGWTIHRDEETKEPYAFDKEGIWASYEDRISTAVKAKYVLERGLGGIGVLTINLEDGYDIAGEGTFPIARTAFNTFKEGLRNVESYPEESNPTNTMDY